MKPTQARGASPRRIVTVRRSVLALTIAATAAVIVLALGGSLAGSLSGAAAESATNASRMLAGIVAIASGAAYLLWSAGRRQLGGALFAGSALMAAAWLALVASRAPSRAIQPLLASDRAQLEEREIDGERWVEHPSLGFRLPQPSVALAPAEEMVREAESRSGAGWRDAHHLWAFESEDHSVSVVLDLSRAPSTDRDLLEARAEAAIAPLRAQGLEVELDTPEAREGCGEARFDATLPQGGRVAGRVWSFEDRRSHRAFHLVATIVAPEGAQAAEYLDAIEIPCAR